MSLQATQCTLGVDLGACVVRIEKKIDQKQGRPYSKIRGTHIWSITPPPPIPLGGGVAILQAGGHENTISGRQGDTIVYSCTQYGRPWEGRWKKR